MKANRNEQNASSNQDNKKSLRFQVENRYAFDNLNFEIDNSILIIDDYNSIYIGKDALDDFI